MKRFVSVLASVICSLSLCFSSFASSLATPSQLDFDDDLSVSSESDIMLLSDDSYVVDYENVVSESSKPSFLSDYISCPAIAVQSSVLSPIQQYGNGISDARRSALSVYFSPSPINNLGLISTLYVYVHFHSSNGFYSNTGDSEFYPTSFSNVFPSSSTTYVLDTDNSTSTDLFYYTVFSYSSSFYVSSVSAVFTMVGSSNKNVGFGSGESYINLYLKSDKLPSVVSVNNSASIATGGGSSSGGSASRFNSNKQFDYSVASVNYGLGHSLRNKARQYSFTASTFI